MKIILVSCHWVPRGMDEPARVGVAENVGARPRAIHTPVWCRPGTERKRKVPPTII